MRVANQAAYTVGRHCNITLLPRSGHVVSEIHQFKQNAKVSDIMGGLKSDLSENRDSSQVYFCPSMSLLHVNMLQDQSKSNPMKSAALIISDKSMPITA